MNDPAAFLDMGGYAAYVWPAYGLTVAVLLALTIISFRSQRNLAAQLKALQATSPHRQRRAARNEGADGL